jgi:NADH-quinone oxidoreductase subunit N
MSGWNIGYALPEWILALFAMIALVRDARSPADDKRGVATAVWVGVLLATLAAIYQGIRYDGKVYAFLGHYGLDAFSVLFKIVFGVTALLVLVLSRNWLQRVDRGHGEFHLLTLFATLGMFFAASVEDFAGLFVSLELITISFYTLTAFKRNDAKSIESAVKYVILGAVASAFLLLGIAFLYGANGSLMFSDLAATIGSDSLPDSTAALLRFGALLTLVGLGFKIAAVPFQVWTPDVYQGAASPVTAFLAMGSKAAGFVLLLKVVRALLGPTADAGLANAAAWVGLLGLIAGATLLYGNLGAMWQGDIKRLLGYSSIGHAGYVLMGVLSFSPEGVEAVMYYLMAYLFTVLAIFAVIVIVNAQTKSHRIDDYSGLGKRSPLLALVLTCGLLSLAGVPPMAGFFGKFLVFTAIIKTGTTVGYILAFIGAAGVVISLYYYLSIVKRLYMAEPPEDAPPFVITPSMKAVLYTCLIGIFVLGVFQGPFVALAEGAANALMAAW